MSIEWLGVNFDENQWDGFLKVIVEEGKKNDIVNKV